MGAHGDWPTTQAELDALNAASDAAFEEWRRIELPKLKVQLLSGDKISRVAIEDGLVTVEEIEAAGFVADEWCNTWARPGFV